MPQRLLPRGARSRLGQVAVGLALTTSTLSLPTPLLAHQAPAAEPAVAPTVVAAGPFAGEVQLRLVTSGLSSPVQVTNAGDGSGRLFVVQRGGLVRVVKNGVLQAGSFLNLTSKVVAGDERGLLGLAFHPNFSSNRKLYAYYTRASDGDIVLAEYTAAVGLASAPASSERILLTIEHSTYGNHNGGSLAFGPDGYLYIGTGDGGGAGDPFENGQDVNELLGKILRIDVNSGSPYASPATNPFVGTAGRDEIWSYGWRNPWRFSFDSANGTMWVGDVGQGSWEEIDRESAAATGGGNYGWDCREGKHWFETAGCDTSAPWPYIDPIIEYSHSYGCAVTGGYVYRGAIFDDLVGNYVYADYCSGNLWSVLATGTSPVYHGASSVNISSFGESESGEIYATDLNGRLYWVVAPPFLDVAQSQFMLDIMWLADSGITSGCGGNNFCPNVNVSRGQMAAFLSRALHLPATSTDYFDDDDGSLFEGDINRLAAAGITGGCNVRAYCPDDPVKRDQMASFLVRALDLPPSGVNAFSDDAGNIHEANINALAASGITAGCAPGLYCPKASVSRGQMAAFLRRALD